MLLGKRSKKVIFLRHLIVALLAALLVWLLFRTRAELPPAQALGRAFGDTAFTLLTLTLLIGPLVRLIPTLRRVLPWRRELGVWFALLGAMHFLREGGFALIFSPYFGVPQMMGLTALFLALLLAATSSDRAVNYLGIGSWKWLHYFSYAIFYLIFFHALSFLTFPGAPKNWFLTPFLILAALVPLAQAAAFITTVRGARAGMRGVATPVKTFSATLLGHERIAEGTDQITLSRPAGFNFEAGQHLELTAAILAYPDARGSMRIFSISSSPNTKEFLTIAFRNSGSGFKRTLAEGERGLALSIAGPFGSFTLPRDQKQPLVCIAGGIGITPFMSMLRFATEEGLANPITLITANKSEANAPYLTELRELAQKNPHLTVHIVFGPLTAESVKNNLSELSSKRYYLAGPPGLVAVARNILTQLGVSEGSIVTEEFDGY